jgi:hypothetical protein
MANTNAPFGFRQIKGTGSAPTYEQNTRYIASDNSTAIYFGDAVIPLTTGYIAQATASTVRVEGIFAGCKYVSVSQKRTVWSNYWPGSDANGDVEAYIIDDPQAKFIVQATSTAIGVTGLNLNGAFTIGTGSTSNGISGAYITAATADVTATLPFRILGLVTTPPGAPGTESGAYNRVIVGFNNVTTRNATGI